MLFKGNFIVVVRSYQVCLYTLIQLSPFLFHRGLVSYIMPFVILTFAIIMLWHKYIGDGKLLEVLEVKPPPSKNAVELILTLQEAISKLEDFLQAANITLLKFRSVLFACVPKVCLLIFAV